MCNWLSCRGQAQDLPLHGVLLCRGNPRGCPIGLIRVVRFICLICDSDDNYAQLSFP